MLLAAAFAVATAASPALRTEPRQQATATVRILRAEPVHFTDIERQQPETLRSAIIRGRDGQSEPARLLEYQ